MNDLWSMPPWLRRLLTRPGGEVTRWQRAVRFSIDLARHGASELRHDKATQMAAALTYYTLFSLLPTIVLAMVVLHAFVGEEDREAFKQSVVEFLFQEAPEAAPEALDSQDAAREEAQAELREVRELLAERIQETMDAMERINFGGIGIVGLLVFIYGATALLAMVERSFNSIFGVSHGRPWYMRLPLYYTVITLAPVVLIAAQVFQGRLLGILEAGEWTGWLMRPAAALMPLLASWLVLFLLYVLLPNTVVQKRAAAIGSLVAAILWVITRELFQFYVAHAAVTTLYGALAVLPLFLLWLWLTWLVILFGVELTYTLGAMKGRTFKHQAGRAQQDQVVEVSWLLPVAARIAEAFDGGRAAGPEELGRSLNLPPRTVRRLLSALEQAGLIHRRQVHEGEAYTLSCPADRITVEQVLEAARSLLPAPPAAGESDPAWRLVRRLREAEREAAEGMTLAQLRDGKVRAGGTGGGPGV